MKEVLCMNVAETIGNNIERLRKESNISQDQLAQIIRVSRPTVSSYLKGNQVIDSNKLYELAKFFNKPMDYFLSEQDDPIPLMFRADNPLENFGDELQSIVEHKVKEYCDILDGLGEKLAYVPMQYNLRVTSEIKLAQDDKEIIEDIASQQREALGIRDIIPNNLYKCFEDKGIRVLATDLPTTKIVAMSAYSENYGCFIVINDNQSISEERKLFSLVHEFGHLIFHRSEYKYGSESLKYGAGKKSINEQMADYFAGTLLIPRMLIKKYVNSISKNPTLNEVLYLKKIFNVSAQAIIMALNNYNLITDIHKSVLFRVLFSKGYKDKEPLPMKQLKKEEGLIEKLKLLLFKDHITENKIAEVLGEKITEVRKMINDWYNENDTLELA